MRIIGCGNPDRGDDAAGLIVVERLQKLGVPALTCTGDLLTLMEYWQPTDDVVLVDATETGAQPGTVKVWDGLLLDTALGGTYSSHGFDLAKVLNLARTLNRLPQRLRIIGIEGRQFSQGDSISPGVLAAIESVTRMLAREANSQQSGADALDLIFIFTN